MNLFVLDNNPRINAEYHVDRHVIKMILESAQLASNVQHLFDGKYRPYKLTHKNHPLTKWASECVENYNYIINYGVNLCYEYTYRYGKTHKTENILYWLQQNQPQNIPSLGNITKHYLAMPPEYRCDDSVNAYRHYYIRCKRHLFKWTRRSVPFWIQET